MLAFMYHNEQLLTRAHPDHDWVPVEDERYRNDLVAMVNIARSINVAEFTVTDLRLGLTSTPHGLMAIHGTVTVSVDSVEVV